VLERELDNQKVNANDREWLAEHIKSTSLVVSDVVFDAVFDVAPSTGSFTLEWLLHEINKYRPWGLRMLRFGCYCQHVQDRIDTEPTVETFFANEDSWDMLETLALYYLETRDSSLSRGAARLLLANHLFTESFLEDEAYDDLIVHVLDRVANLEEPLFFFSFLQYPFEREKRRRKRVQ